MPAPRRFTPPEVCPVCGEDDVPRRARACPGCGADERSGWGLDADAAADDGEDPFDYDGFVRGEFGGGGGGRLRPTNLRRRWWIAGVVVFLLVLLSGLGLGLWP